MDLDLELNRFRSEFPIGSLSFGGSRTPVLIAETACSHGGDVDTAKQLAKAAAEGGADIIQLQIFRRDHQFPPAHRLYDALEPIEFSDEQWREIFEFAHSTGKDVMAFVYDVPSLQLALKLNVVALKLNSSDLLNKELLEGCADSGLPIFLGTGASTMDEVRQSLGTLQARGANKVILMHGVQDFPTAVKDCRLDRLKLLREEFGLPVGYGDHTDASTSVAKSIDLLAVGMGASVLEKHIAMDRERCEFDFEAALNPHEWSEYSQLMKDACSGLSFEPPGTLNEVDKRYRLFQKKYAVATCDIEMGESLSTRNVKFLRLEEPGEISAVEFEAMNSPRATKRLSAGEAVLNSDIACS